MALNGVHVVCAYAGGRGYGDSRPACLSRPAWSETLTVAGSTTKVASLTGYNGDPLFRVRGSVDFWGAVGAVPNAGIGGPRFFVPANTDYDVFVKEGDSFAWVGA